jgi:tRNA A-37 threonylcarbamoyl transferase component Bud32
MAFIDIAPRYQAFLEQRGLAGAEPLLALPAVVVSGHPDRNVARVTLGRGPSALSAFLKREHRVPWRDRLANAWAGFGWVSKSHREFQVLRALGEAGVGCPEAIAAGEDKNGRAFLLVRELTEACELRVFLQKRLAGEPGSRRHLARRLGEAVARFHEAGFDHPDLYSKHVLVGPAAGPIWVVDWQRSRRRRFLSWGRRWRDLAALDATLAGDLTAAGERLTFLLAYLRAVIQVGVPRAFLAGAARAIGRRSRRLQRRRRIREQRQPPLPAGAQHLIRLDGEALCVTREFHEEMLGEIPEWLGEVDTARNHLSRQVVSLPGLRLATLVRRCSHRPWRWLWGVVTRRPPVSPELEQAGMLFRLQRFGVGTPRLLAVGQRRSPPGRTESFLLTEKPEGAIPLASWLQDQAGRPLWTAERKQRRRWLREAGRLLRHVHEAGYHVDCFHARSFLVRAAPAPGDDSPPGTAVALGSLDGLVRWKGSRLAGARLDLAALRRAFTPNRVSRTDELRVLLGYLGLQRLTPAARSLARALSQNRLDRRPWLRFARGVIPLPRRRAAS